MTQPGQKTLTTGLPGLTKAAGLAIDNGGPEFTLLPVGGGTFIANGVTPVVVADTDVKAGSIIVPSMRTPGGTVGAVPAVQSITPGVGFTVIATALDTSTYSYGIFG